MYLALGMTGTRGSASSRLESRKRRTNGCSYTFSANHHIVGYKPPGYNALRTTLLQKMSANIKRCLLTIKQTWNEKGLSIVSDRQGDPKRRLVIMAVTESGNMFLIAENCEGEMKKVLYCGTTKRYNQRGWTI